MQLQPEFESMSRPELQKLQFQRLQKLLENVYEKVPFYRQSFDKHGVKPSDLKSLQDLQKFPFTYKQDLRDNYPFNLALADKKDFVRIHASSGTILLHRCQHHCHAGFWQAHQSKQLIYWLLLNQQTKL